MLFSPDHYKTSYTLRFNFNMSNNEAKYDTVIVDLDWARELRVETIEVFTNSMLIVNHVTGAFQVKEE